MLVRLNSCIPCLNNFSQEKGSLLSLGMRWVSRDSSCVRMVFVMLVRSDNLWGTLVNVL